MNSVEDMMGTTIDKIKEMVDVETIIGEPIKANNGSMIIPISKVSYGFASGGSDFGTKKSINDNKNMFGGGGGAGITITPIAFLVVTENDVKLLQIESFTGALDRIISMAPDLVSRICSSFKKNKNKNHNCKKNCDEKTINPHDF